MTETRTLSKGPVLLSFTVFLAVLLGLFSVQMKGALGGFDRWVGHEDHRLPNLRQIDETCRWPVLTRFMNLQPLSEADAFIFGDSQIYARGATQEELFYTHWLGGDAVVINFSYFSGPVGDMHQIAEELNRRGHKGKYAYTALNLTHFTTSIYAHEYGNIPSPNDGILPEKPNSITSLWSNRFVCAFKYRKKYTENTFRTPRYRTLIGDYKNVNLPEGYLNFKRENFDIVTQHYLSDYPEIAEVMIIASAPMAHDKFSDYNYDEAKIESFNKAYSELCSTIETPLNCLDLITKFNSEGFGDLIHMNAKGHKKLGEYLKKSFPNN